MEPSLRTSQSSSARTGTPVSPAAGDRALPDRVTRPVSALVVDQPVPVPAGQLGSLAEAQDGDGGRVRVGDQATGRGHADRLAERGQDRIPLPQDTLGPPPLADIPEGDHTPRPAGPSSGADQYSTGTSDPSRRTNQSSARWTASPVLRGSSTGYCPAGTGEPSGRLQ
jgi:hypothetical protein